MSRRPLFFATMALVLAMTPVALINDVAPVGATVAGSASALSGLQLGAYDGSANPIGVESFGQETGAHMSIYSDFLDGTTWPDLTGRPGAPPWVISQIKGTLGDMRLLLSVPLVQGRHTGQASLAGYAADANGWDGHFKVLAENLVAAGFGNAIIRLMWEPDSGIYSNDDLTSAANYATLWRDAWHSMMGVSGAHFQWAWYWGGGFDATTNNTAYPGDSYVDYVTFDLYDQSWNSACAVPYNGSNFTQTQEACLWSDAYSKVLGGLTSFAAVHDKPTGIGEFGVISRSDGHGGGDDPYFVKSFASWLASNHVAWASYFNFNSSGDDSILANFPNSLATFRADFGN
jgi:hypothetical protein